MVIINPIYANLIKNTYRTLLTSHEDILNKIVKDTYPNVAEQNQAFEDIKQLVYEDELKTIEELKTRIDNILDTYADNPVSLENINNQLEHIISTVLIKSNENSHSQKRGLGKGITPIDASKDKQLLNNKTGKGIHALFPTDDDKG